MAEKVSDALEAALTSHRMQELAAQPVQGKFDAAHLNEVHRRIFQDLPSHRPGEHRSQNFSKHRALESQRKYVVPYADSADLAEKLDTALAPFSKPESLKNLAAAEFSERMGKLYADLDYLHPYNEGNSRTLRAFTSQLAKESGFKLDWAQTANSADARDTLYIARDKEIFSRLYPGLDQTRAALTEDRREYEAYMHFVRHYAAAKPLKEIVSDAVRKQSDLDAAAAFKGEGAEQALKKFPHLAGAYAAMAIVDRQVKESGLGQAEQRTVIDAARQNLVAAIERGKTPAPTIRENAAALPKAIDQAQQEQTLPKQRGLDR